MFGHFVSDMLMLGYAEIQVFRRNTRYRYVGALAKPKSDLNRLGHRTNKFVLRHSAHKVSRGTNTKHFLLYFPT